MSCYQNCIFLPGRPFIHYFVVQCFFLCIISSRIGIDPQISLEWRPYPGYKKFAEPITIALCITLVTMRTKNPADDLLPMLWPISPLHIFLRLHCISFSVATMQKDRFPNRDHDCPVPLQTTFSATNFFSASNVFG